MIYVCIILLLLLVILGFIVYHLLVTSGSMKSKIEVLEKRINDEKDIQKIKNDVKLNIDELSDRFE